VLPAPLPQRRRLLPKQISCTESGAAGDFGVGGAEAYTRYFSRQNTSEDSANVTVSTVLAQSDSQSLHATPSYANTPPATGSRIQERRKSRSTGLLAVRPPYGMEPSAVVITMEEGSEGEGGQRGRTRTLVPDKLHRMTSTSTGSSVAATGCCSATKPKEKPGEAFRPSAMASSAARTTAQSTGSDDEYRRRKRKYSK